MKKRIADYIRAGYAGLYVVSHEEARVEAVLASVVEDLNKLLPPTKADPEKFNLFSWSVTEGLLDVTGDDVVKAECDALDMLAAFSDAPARSIYLARDFHFWSEDKNPMVWRKIKDGIAAGKGHNKCLIILGCRLTLPPELEKEITVIDFALPNREQLREKLVSLIADNGFSPEQVDEEAGLLDAASGLTTTEAEQAFALSLVETGRITKDIVFREKCQAVRKNGLLEIVDSKITLDDVGGLEALKKWLLERRDAFGDDAKTYKLPTPKGMLAVGQPGTGKSLIAKACKSVFDVPLLRLDAAKLFGSLVGQSEQNWRTAHATAMAMAPCVLWIDEADGAFSGSKSSGQTDGGTTARVIKSILQDMQENSEGIFYVLTANDVDNLPAPLLRRMDEIWNVELPNPTEREIIWNIQIAKHGRNAADYDLPTLTASSDGYSGAEIEKVFIQALYRGFAERREPTADDLSDIFANYSPLSKTMAKDIEERRARLSGVAKLASGPVSLAKSTPKPVRKIQPLRRVS